MIQAVKRIIFPVALLLAAEHAAAQVTFCAVGDILLDRGVRKKIDETKNSFYPFEHIQHIISENDLAFFNMECPLVEESKGAPLFKRFSFRAEPDFAKDLSAAGFNIASVANNHTIDYGKAGFIETINNLKSYEIYPVGGGKNQHEAFEPLLIEKDGNTFAFFAVLEFLLEAVTYNADKPYPAYGKIDSLCKLIERYNALVDHVVVSFHWGKEGVYMPSGRQVLYAHKVIDAGADLVLGHHPHVLQPVEIYRNKLILYSLGNFIFDNTGEAQKQSAIFQCTFTKSGITHPELLPVSIIQNRPEPADSNTSKKIFNHLQRISADYNTTFLSMDNIVEISYSPPSKPIQEFRIDKSRFVFYDKHIEVYRHAHLKCLYEIPDTNYTFRNACYEANDSLAFFYSIIMNEISEKGQIAVFPYSFLSNSFLKPSIDHHRHYNPWKIILNDIDNDGRNDLLVGVYKKTRYHEEKDNRLFVFNTDKNYIYPKWLGSRIGKPFVDFTVINDGINRLVVLEKNQEENQQNIEQYIWNGFGFDHDKSLCNASACEELYTRFNFPDREFIHIR